MCQKQYLMKNLVQFIKSHVKIVIKFISDKRTHTSNTRLKAHKNAFKNCSWEIELQYTFIVYYNVFVHEMKMVEDSDMPQ